MKYEEIKEDWEYLWAIGPANDMTGGYVDQEDLQKLLDNPTKATAKICLKNQMEYWFSVGVEPKHRYSNTGDDPHIYEDKYPRIREIAEKYKFDY